MKRPQQLISGHAMLGDHWMIEMYHLPELLGNFKKIESVEKTESKKDRIDKGLPTSHLHSIHMPGFRFILGICQTRTSYLWIGHKIYIIHTKFFSSWNTNDVAAQATAGLVKKLGSRLRCYTLNELEHSHLWIQLGKRI
jgi:hypothetical protein